MKSEVGVQKSVNVLADEMATEAITGSEPTSVSMIRDKGNLDSRVDKIDIFPISERTSHLICEGVRLAVDRFCDSG